MSRKKKKDPIVSIIKILILVEVVIIGIYGIIQLFNIGKKKATEKIADTVIETTVKHAADKIGIDREKVDEILESVDEDDKKKVYEIIEDHVDAGTIQKGIEYAQKGDIKGFKDYASKELSESEMKTLMDLYDKYKDSVK